MSVMEPKFHCRKEEELTCSETQLQIQLQSALKAATRFPAGISVQLGPSNSDCLTRKAIRTQKHYLTLKGNAFLFFFPYLAFPS